MKKRTPDKFWFPWWPDKWIFGSIRIECTPIERGIWVDLLSLASKDNGHIRANEETPYPMSQLAGMLILPEDVLDKAIKKFIKMGKLNKTKTGTLYVAKWNKYQFSDRHKRRVMSDDKDVESKKGTPILNKNKLNEIKGKDNIIYFSFTDKQFHNITIEDKELWNKAYPACDIDMELLKMSDWLLSNPDKRKKQYRRFITNWLSRTQDKGGTKMTKDEKRKKGLDDWAKEKPKEDNEK